MNIAEKRRKIASNHKTLYQRTAEKFDVHYNYVSRIARGERKAIRGLAKEIREHLEECVNNGEV